MEWFMDTGIRIVIILAVAIIIFIVARIIIPTIIRRLISRRMESILVTIAGIVIAIITILTILPEFGVNVTTLIAGLGVGGLAIAFAAQNLVRDVITGFLILLEDQYRVGDVVNIAGISGLVEEITLRRSILRDLDGAVHSVPNGKVEVSSNFTRNFSRVNMNISVGYGENLERVIEVINRVCKEMAEDPAWKEDFITTPEVLRVDKLGDSGIDIKILCDAKPSRQWPIMGELRLRIKNTFDREGIEIPWPHTKVYFGNNPAITSSN
jgi:small conductance mechanosensitive channel